jgi:hypothetical protein
MNYRWNVPIDISEKNLKHKLKSAMEVSVECVPLIVLGHNTVGCVQFGYSKLQFPGASQYLKQFIHNSMKERNTFLSKM